MLTKSEIRDINLRMLYRGAPVSLDYSGYNSYDFGYMDSIADIRSEWSDLVTKNALKILKKYVNTQLKDQKDQILETLKYYESLYKSVKVVSSQVDFIELTWSYDRKIQEAVQPLTRSGDARWRKDGAMWILQAKWYTVEALVESFKSRGYVVEEVESAFNAHNKTKAMECATVPLTHVKVLRPSNTVDTLYLSFPYDAELVSAIKSVPNEGYIRKFGAWEIKIHSVAQAYNALKDKHVDLSEMEEWVDLVSGWEVSGNEAAKLDSKNMKFEPWAHQVKDVNTLLSKSTCLNANEMGLGKTFEQVWVGESINTPKLVICPPSLRLNWAKEIKMVNPSAEVHIQYSDQPFQSVQGWNIIGYSSLIKFLSELEKCKFQCVMLDEAHYIQAVKNTGEPGSQRAFAAMRICATSKHVYPITGTPKTKRNRDMYNLFRVLRHPLSVGTWSFMNYGKMYCNGYRSDFGWDFNGNSRNDELGEELSKVMVRNMKKDVLPHLKKQRIMLPAEVSLTNYRAYIDEYIASKAKDGKRASLLAVLQKAKQSLAIEKCSVSAELAESIVNSGEKVVIVTCFTYVVEHLVMYFGNACVKLVGGMTDSQKQDAIDRFQDPDSDIKVIVMNIIAGGVGVTLTRAHHLIVNDFDWTPGNLVQAEDRICRGGQEAEYSTIHYLYAAGADIDEVIVSKLTDRFKSINAVVDGGEGDEVDFLELIEEAIQQ